MDSSKKEWYSIVNPHAGSGKTMSEWAVADRRLSDLGIEYTTVLTKYKSHAAILAADAAAQGYRKFLAVGGDGSVHEVFSGILGYALREGIPTEDFYIGVIPIGSGNDWIKSLGVPHDTQSIIDLIAGESFAREDVIKVSSSPDSVSYMANIGGVGFDSHVCERVNSQKEAGKRSARIYVSALMHTILNLRKIKVEVLCDDQSAFSGKCYSIAIGNGVYSGGGMKQTPLSDIDDSLIDVMVAPVMPLHVLARELPRIFKGTVAESKRIIYKKCSNLKVVPLDARSADIIEVDGEVEGTLPLEVEATGHKINVIVGR